MKHASTVRVQKKAKIVKATNFAKNHNISPLNVTDLRNYNHLMISCPCRSIQRPEKKSRPLVFFWNFLAKNFFVFKKPQDY